MQSELGAANVWRHCATDAEVLCKGRMHSGPRTQFGIPKHPDQEPGPQVEMCVYIVIIYNIYI